MKGLIGIVAGLCCALVIACAASSKTASMATAPQTSGAAGGGDARAQAHDQIEELDRQIAAERERMNLPAPSEATTMSAGTEPTAAPPAPALRTPAKPPGQDQLCHHAASDTCTDSCTLADSICGNAQKICDLAKQLAGDAWAAGKCATASQTCDAARGRCCGCT